MSGNKYLYWKIIQGRYNGVWEDLDWHVADSTGHLRDHKLFKQNMSGYREAEPTTAFRVIKRRELNAWLARQ